MADPSPPSSLERSPSSSSGPRKRKAAAPPPPPPPPLHIHGVQAKKQRIISTSEFDLQTTNSFQPLRPCSVTILDKHRQTWKFNTTDDQNHHQWTSSSSRDCSHRQTWKFNTRDDQNHRQWTSSSSSSRDCSHRQNWKFNTRHDQNHRQWTSSSRDCSQFKDKVIMVSYNILGVENASNHPHLYQRVSPRFLKWNWRKKLIIDELNRYNPSILCLQEVDRFSELAELLQEDGFKGVYKARTGEAHDGCAIFWKEERYSLLHQEDIEFREFGLRDNVGQFCVLKLNSSHPNDDVNAQLLQAIPTRTLLVGNIHVLFSPNRGDIKLGQIRLFIEKANTISQGWGSIPVVLAGDFNSTPQSAIYQFLASSELDILLHDRKEICGQNKSSSRWRTFGSQSWDANSWSEEELLMATGSEEATYLQHHLQLGSAYVGIPGNSSTRDRYGEPLATSYHSKFKGTVDYIWHSKELIPVRVLETLPMKILRETRGLPNEKWGSDHLALVCELAFKDTGNET